MGINGHAESIVRDGVWSLIPGGAHIENLKKGDIIFSTTQTDALLKHGAIQGHARAYASGTVTSPGVMKAYAAAGNTPGFHFQGGAATVKPAGSGNSGNSGNSGLQHAIEDNTDAVSNNSDDTSDAADEVSEALQNVIKKLNDNAMDWVEVAMDRLDRITSRYTDLAESDYSHYTKAQKYYNKALENTDKEIKAAKASISVYKRKSEEVANNGEVSKYLTPALKKKVQDGTINIETLDANQKAAVEAYKQWYDKYLDAVQKYRDKKTQELDLAKSKVDNVYDSYDLIISKRKAKEEYYAAKAENRIKSGKSQKVGSVYWKDLKKQVSYAQYQKDWMLKERDKVQQSMTDYLNVNGHNKKDKAYQEMKKNLTDLNTSIVEADTHIQEAKAALEETRENLKQWQIDRWERAGDKQDASGNNLRDAMEYAYKNGANHSNQSYTAVEGFKKAYLKDWTNSLPNRPDGATDVPAGVSPLIGYFNAKGKKVGPKEMQQLADILQINTPGVKKYDSWGSTLKNKILKAYKSYGFSKGGVVRKGIPANILDMIGGDALIPRGDSMLIGANPGETVLTKEFTDQLKPTVATLNEFNARMAKPITTILPSSSNDTSVNSECNITINVDKINNEQDIKKLAYQIGDIITERNKRDWKKVR